MLNKSLILQQTSLQEGNVGYQPPGRGPHSQINMGRLLIDELQQAASLVDFKEMLNRSAALTKFAKQLPTSAILLNDLKAMVKGDTLHCLLAIETLAVIEDERANALLPGGRRLRLQTPSGRDYLALRLVFRDGPGGCDHCYFLLSQARGR